MSLTQYIAIHKYQVLSTEQVQSRAKQLGFDLQVDHADLRTHTGFLPCELHGKQAGFGWFVEDSSISTQMGAEVGDRNCVCTLTTHGDEAEGQSAMIAAIAILELTQGVYFDEYQNVDTCSARLLDEVRTWMKG